MAKIDYDVGDLIYSTRNGERTRIKKGQVFTCLEIAPSFNINTGLPDIGVRVDGPIQPPSGARYFTAFAFRKLPKKSQEFFAGETQTVKDLVPAE